MAGLAKYYRRAPDQLTEHEVQRYLVHLIDGYRHEIDAAGPLVSRFADLPAVIASVLAAPR